MRKNAKLPRLLGKRIKQRRQQLEMTQEDLAAATGISRVYVGYIEQARHAPSLEVLEKIAKNLKIKLSDLLD